MSKKKSLFRSYVSLATLINRYVIAFLLFASWMLFFDKYRISNSIKLNRTITKLTIAKEDYIQKIAQSQINKAELEENSEKYAREKFFMHKENEEVFIIEK